MSRCLVAWVAALLLSACGSIGSEAAPYRPPALYPPPPEEIPAAEIGQFLYGRDCSSCHGSGGEGTARGPALSTGTNGPALTDFMLRTGRMPIVAESAPTRHSDPVYPDAQMSALVEYIDAEFQAPGPDIPHLDVTAGDVARGQQLYQQNCAACHATTGIGGAMLTQRGRATVGGTAGIIIPDLSHSTMLEVAEAVRTGPGTMPVFNAAVLSDEQLDDVVRYVAVLQDPPDAGGAGIGHTGPFGEGLVGWLVGLGSLVIFVYVVGTKMKDER